MVVKRHPRKSVLTPSFARLAPVPEGWLDPESVADAFTSRLQVAERSAADLDVPQLTVLLGSIQPRFRSVILKRNRLSAAVTIQRPMVEHMLSLLRKAPDGGLVADLTAPLQNLLSIVELEGWEWNTLFGSDDVAAFDVMDRNPRVLEALSNTENIPDALRLMGLCAAIRTGVPASALAFALLAASEADARGDLEALGGSEPAIPEAPLTAVLPKARLQSLGQPVHRHIDSDAVRSLVMNSRLQDVSPPVLAVDDEVSGAVDDSVDDLNYRDATGSPHEAARWTLALDACLRSATALEAGNLPAAEDLAVVELLVEDAIALANELSISLDRHVAPSRADLTAASEEIKARLHAADVEWLRELAEVAPPTHLTGFDTPLRTLKSAIGGLLESETPPSSSVLGGLRALHRLIQVTEGFDSGIVSDITEIAELTSTASALLPMEMQILVNVAAGGRLRLPATTPAYAEEITGAAAPSAQVHIAVDDAASPPAGPTTEFGEEYDLADLDALLAAEAASASSARAQEAKKTDRVERGAAVCEADQGRAADEPGDRDEPADIDNLDSRLLAEHRFGLAADLCEAANRPEASVAARRLGALALGLRSATGEIAAAFAEQVEIVRALTDDRAGQLVAWAAAVRVAALAPSIGAAGLILDFESCVVGFPAVLAAGTAFAEASRAGLVVVPSVSATVSTIAEAERVTATLARKAGELRANASDRTIKYIPANAVYQAWMGSDGVLGALLRDVESNDHAQADSVRDRILALRDRGQVDIEIDTTFTAQRRQVPGRTKIVADARIRLTQRYGEALEAAQEWADAVAGVDEARRRGHAAEDWLVRPYERLRHTVNSVRGGVLAQLAEHGPEDYAWRAFEGLIRQALDISDGHAPIGRETSVELALHEELLGSELPLDLPDLTPADRSSTETLAALTALAVKPRRTLADAYAVRAKAGEHDLTELIVRAAVSTSDELGHELARRRLDAVRSGKADTEKAVSHLMRSLDVGRLNGNLTEDVWSGLAARAEALSEDTSNNFRRIIAGAAELTEEAHGARAYNTSKFVVKLDKQAQGDERIAAQSDMLRAMAEKGNLASAEELLEQISSGRVLPGENVGDDSFSGFFPKIPDFVSMNRNVLADLKAVLTNGSDHTSAGKRLSAVGLVPGSLGSDRAKRAVQALDAWRNLRANASKVDATSLLRALLGEAGLEFAQARKDGTDQGRTWYLLSGVKGTGEALTPDLGSRMNPSGTTLRVLLVHKASTPATLIEWMRNERADQTVLVLWLTGTALSAKDRRAIGEAAKGRPKPTVLVLDEASLAFLVCRPEPRRSTFEAISRPFTAASPYADTPGDTPPEMFFGRLEELDAVVDFQGPSIFYGGRQLGKSALLRMAQRRFDDGVDRRAVLVSIFTVGAHRDPEKLWRELWPKLAEAGVVRGARPTSGDLAELTHDAIVTWIRAAEHRSLLIMLDEADAFLEADAENGFVHVDWWRKIRDDTHRRAKVVFAGLHRTGRFDSMTNQPLGHLLPPVLVGPLSPQAAHNLLVRPLAALGYRFADPVATPARMLAQANNMPALLQLFGAALVGHLSSSRTAPVNEPWSLITDEDVDTVFANADLRELFRNKYMLTLNLDHRYMVIAYLVALSAYERDMGTSMTLQELYTRAGEVWPAGFADCRFDEFRFLVDECADLGILAADAGRYRMRTPTVRRLLGTDIQLMQTLTEADEILVAPSKRDVGSYRHTMVGSAHRMPLTERQLGEVYRARPRLLVITGSAQLGINRVVPALEQVDRGGTQRLGLHIVDSRGLRDLSETLNALAARPTLAVADLTKASVAEVSAVLAQWHGLSADGPDVTLAVVVNGATGPAWIGHDIRVDLARINGAGLRHWAEEDLPKFADEASRSSCLSKTGGWPLVLESVVAGSAWSPTGNDAVRLVESVGLGAGDGNGGVSSALAEVFTMIAELTGGSADYEDEIRSVLEDDEQLSELTTAAGFISAGAALDTLLALDCLVRDASSKIGPEPVLLRAMRAASAK